MSKSRVWVVTGCSSGLGMEICLSALARGDKVIATCRGDPATRLANLIAHGADVLSLDVASPLNDIQAFAKKAIAINGHVDIICNNAGYVQYGALEETCPEETLKQFQTCVFGPLNVARAFLPHMRERKKGVIAIIGSAAAGTSIPGCGNYTASKSAIAAFTLALAAEVLPLNIQAICIEPGEYRTAVFTKPTVAAVHIPAYDEVLVGSRAIVNPTYKQPGDPRKGAERIVDLLTGAGLAKGRKLPTRIMLGDDVHTGWKSLRAGNQEAEDAEWQEWSTGTNFDNE
ncbi:short chain dehydrogenase [Ramaria rubella]|nr:short chain dehydrogenase [Ramaria rubella]